MSEPVTFALRAAALLRGGVSSQHVIESIARESGAHRAANSRLLNRIERGQSVSEALSGEQEPGWRVLALAWSVAEESGAPFANTLERMAQALLSLARLADRRSVLLAGPRMTVVIVCTLPLIAFAVGELTGFEPVRQLLQPGGALLLIVGSLFLITGMAWSWQMIRAVARQDQVPGFELDLLWIALAAGHSTSAALKLVIDCADAVPCEWVRLASFVRESPARKTLHIAEATGAPVGPLLLAAADELRAQTLTELERSAEKLAVRVLIPLGCCILPGFLVTGVVPVVMSMLAGV